MVFWIHLSTKPGNHRARDHRAVCLMLFWPWWEFSTWGATCYIQFLYSVGLLIWYRTSICTHWHTSEPGFSHGRRPNWQDHISKYIPVLCSPLSPSLSLSLSSNAVGGTTTQTGPGTCTLIVHMRTPAPSAVLCLTPAALLSLERCVFSCAAS